MVSMLRSPCSYKSMDIHASVKVWILGPGTRNLRAGGYGLLIAVMVTLGEIS